MEHARDPDADLSRWNVNQTGAVTQGSQPQSHHSRKKTDGAGAVVISAWI